MIEVDELSRRFERACVAAGATSPALAIFEELAARYQETHRHYHTLAHIDACLSWLDWFCAFAEHPEEVELALWFHDAVYDRTSSDNERRSALLALEKLGEIGIDGSVRGRIAQHIEGTEKHISRRGDSALVIDLDLTILGSQRAEFDRFEGQIRREYAYVPEEVYRSARAQVLEGFLARSRIYDTALIFEQLETTARTNLKRRIVELRANAQQSLSGLPGR